MTSTTSASAFDLSRFVDAQRGVIEGALEELRGGRKVGHWMWFVFPQLRGLGRSETSRYFGLSGIEEARAYLGHPTLASRLRAAGEAILAAPGDAVTILGPIDAMKLRSSATVFHRAAPDNPLFPALLERFYDGIPDPATDDLLGTVAAQRSPTPGPGRPSSSTAGCRPRGGSR